jgi:DNA-binding transcriptional ArsR family regulator
VLSETAIFRALGDPTRRALFEQLTRGEATVKELVAGARVSQPAVSQHLAALREAGLVADRQEGRLVHYRVNPQGLRPLIDWIGRYQAFWLERLEKLHRVSQEMDE